LRDYDGYAETRRKVLLSKPTIDVNWTSFAVANYLVKKIYVDKLLSGIEKRL
jgi:hypothetical protein